MNGAGRCVRINLDVRVRRSSSWSWYNCRQICHDIDWIRLQERIWCQNDIWIELQLLAQPDDRRIVAPEPGKVCPEELLFRSQRRDRCHEFRGLSGFTHAAHDRVL